MNFLDLFFPEQAQATYLNQIAIQGQIIAREQSRQRFHLEQKRRVQESKTQDMEKRVEQLERDLCQAGLVIETLLELLEEAKVLNRQSVALRAHEIDARDGVIDGQKTPPSPPPKEPFIPKRRWNGPREG